MCVRLNVLSRIQGNITVTSAPPPLRSNDCALSNDPGSPLICSRQIISSAFGDGHAVRLDACKGLSHASRVVCLRPMKGAATPTPVAHDRSFLAIALAPLGGLNADPSKIHPSLSLARRISEVPKMPASLASLSFFSVICGQIRV